MIISRMYTVKRVHTHVVPEANVSGLNEVMGIIKLRRGIVSLRVAVIKGILRLDGEYP